MSVSPEVNGVGYPNLTPRADRLLLYWYPENVRDLESTPEYLRLSPEAKGVLTVLRHLFLHHGLLPNDPSVLTWLSREYGNEEVFRRSIPAILESGQFV